MSSEGATLHGVRIEPNNDYVVKDSGTRTEYKSGMVRDGSKASKVNYTRIYDGVMADRWAEHLTRAEPKYPDVEVGVPNWTLADSPEEMEDYRVSAARHFRQWLRGETDEDHAAAVLFNIDGYEFVKAKIDALRHVSRRRQEAVDFGPGTGIKRNSSYFGPWFGLGEWSDLGGTLIDAATEGSDGPAEKSTEHPLEETGNDADSPVQQGGPSGPHDPVAPQPPSEEGD